ncbi:hypothetical protein ISS99_17420 [Dyella mobilis]|uniref:MFS transporter n=1 Tax=Dyella mobilis TaxID=1849582 RepID=A0ABS2KJG5_9GAMM|nr:hypothetical protein [Dyella mobilis]
MGHQGEPPIAIGLGIAIPLLSFFAWLKFSPALRRFVIALDPRFVVAMQAWRWGGLGFLFLYAHNVLPAAFALPAGSGDMAIGISAPWILAALLRQPDFATSAAFARWNVLGIIDLIVAISLGTLLATLATGAPGEISTAPMASLPLLLIPVFFVPLFLMLHAIMLMQRREKIRDRA